MANLKVVKDSKDGVLYIAEGTRQIPFEIKRVYFIDNLKYRSVRGFHAHKKLKQVIFCLRGSCEMESFDGKLWKSEILRQPDKGIYIKPLVWHSLRKFSKDCLLAVFASDIYDESDYIRDLDDFKDLVL